jgi:ferredoxin
MSGISRRDLFRSMLGRKPADVPVPAGKTAVSGKAPPLALILDRFCLAWQGSFCSVCVERCPVEGAITTELGKPRVNPDPCTGCRICHEVCPAPKNAVFLVDRKPRQGMVSRPAPPNNT